MAEEDQTEEMSKRTNRQKIWNYMVKNELLSFPAKVVFKNIPNFKGADEAAKRLGELKEFKDAKVIKVNPDKPQEAVRLMSLEAGKEILVPIPRLKMGLFVHVVPPADATPEEIKILATRQELLKHGKSVGIDAKISVDLVVLGAVCVDRSGHRIGKGEGFADLEFAMMMRMGAIRSDTLVVTTVHDCQIVDELPETLFEKHDVPVDLIVTPTQTIVISERLKKPEGIFWDILTPRRVKSMQILQQMKEIDEKDGKEIVLKKEEPREQNHFRRTKRPKGKKRSESKSKIETEDENTSKDVDSIKPRVPRKRPSRSRKIEKENSPDNHERQEKPEKPLRRKPMKYRSKSHIDFSLKLSNIRSDVRIRDLKNALGERGVRPTDITWRGQRGFCYLHFGKLRGKDTVPNEPVQVDSIVANLQQLRIGPAPENADDEFVIVEPTKPITKIEVIDATAV